MTIHRLMTASFFCVTLISSLTPVFALDAAQVPTSKRTKPGLYLDAKEAYEMKQQQGDKVLFVDIRTRGEITYTGVAANVDAYVPMYEHPPNAAWDEKAGRFQLELNKDFEKEIARRANAKGLSKSWSNAFFIQTSYKLLRYWTAQSFCTKINCLFTSNRSNTTKRCFFYSIFW